MATVISGKSNKCEGSLQKSKFAAGTKNPCPICGHNTTTKRDGVQRSHPRRKVKEPA
jgi:hypothetical protein